jgi:hypothetical protein
LSYWLRLTPPFMLSAADRELDGLFREERELLEQLRGAYFLVLSPTLPLHLLWSDMELADRMALDDPARRNWFYSPDVARNEMEQVERALTDLAGRLQACAPTDAERRRDPSVTPRAVGCHARQSRSTLAAVKRISD